jgi:hypothetical protein
MAADDTTQAWATIQPGAVLIAAGPSVVWANVLNTVIPDGRSGSSLWVVGSLLVHAAPRTRYPRCTRPPGRCPLRRRPARCRSPSSGGRSERRSRSKTLRVT